MTSSSINSVRLVGRGATIDHLGKELNSAQFETTRGPRYFSASTTTFEYVNVIVPAAASAISVLAGILIAKINNGRVKVVFREGLISEVEASSEKQLKKILETVKEIHLD